MTHRIDAPDGGLTRRWFHSRAGSGAHLKVVIGLPGVGYNVAGDDLGGYQRTVDGGD